MRKCIGEEVQWLGVRGAVARMCCGEVRRCSGEEVQWRGGAVARRCNVEECEVQSFSEPRHLRRSVD